MIGRPPVDVSSAYRALVLRLTRPDLDRMKHIKASTPWLSVARKVSHSRSNSARARLLAGRSWWMPYTIKLSRRYTLPTPLKLRWPTSALAIGVARRSNCRHRPWRDVDDHTRSDAQSVLDSSLRGLLVWKVMTAPTATSRLRDRAAASATPRAQRRRLRVSRA